MKKYNSWYKTWEYFCEEYTRVNTLEEDSTNLGIPVYIISSLGDAYINGDRSQFIRIFKYAMGSGRILKSIR